MQKPTYSQAVRDAIDAVERLAERTGINELQCRLVTSTLRSLSPEANKRYERKRSAIAEQALFEIACRVVQSANDDLAFAEQRPEPSFGNVFASVTFSPNDVIRWARYAATKRHKPAMELLDRIEVS